MNNLSVQTDLHFLSDKILENKKTNNYITKCRQGTDEVGSGTLQVFLHGELS